MGVNSLPKTVARQRREFDLNPGPSAPESSMLTTRLPSHPPSNFDKLNREINSLTVNSKLSDENSSHVANVVGSDHRGTTHEQTLHNRCGDTRKMAAGFAYRI